MIWIRRTSTNWHTRRDFYHVRQRASAGWELRIGRKDEALQVRFWQKICKPYTPEETLCSTAPHDVDRSEIVRLSASLAGFLHASFLFVCTRPLGYDTRFAHSEVHRHELQLVLHMCMFDISYWLGRASTRNVRRNDVRFSASHESIETIMERINFRQGYF